MADHGELLDDPDFQRLLRRRSRLRWGLSGLLVAVYIGYGLAGLYAAEVLARPLPGSAITWSLVLGYGIILLGIACSIFYVWQVNRIIAPLQQRLAREYR
ncbi:MAG: DUF485 domain-containing protein [Woeseia sp.]